MDDIWTKQKHNQNVNDNGYPAIPHVNKHLLKEAKKVEWANRPTQLIHAVWK